MALPTRGALSAAADLRRFLGFTIPRARMRAGFFSSLSPMQPPAPPPFFLFFLSFSARFLTSRSETRSGAYQAHQAQAGFPATALLCVIVRVGSPLSMKTIRFTLRRTTKVMKECVEIAGESNIRPNILEKPCAPPPLQMWSSADR